jgi:hypothetical protein
MIEVLLAGLLAGGLAGAGTTTAIAYRALRRRPAHVDYQERWLQAVSLLGQEGRLTDEQVASLSGDGVTAPPVAATPADDQALLDAMSSWDRRQLAVRRARSGLPPLDSLRGMESWDQRVVLEARAQQARRKKRERGQS